MTAAALRSDSRFPERRLVPLGLAAACFLVTSMGQRAILLSLVRQEAHVTTRDAWQALVLGTRTDLAVASLALVIPLLWATLLPHRAWISRAHRLTAGALLVAGLAGWLALLVVEGRLFVRTWRRFGPGTGEHVRAWLEGHASGDGGPLLLVVAASSFVLVALVSVALLRPWLAEGFRTRVALSARLRDAILILALGALAVATSFPRPVAFPDRRVLQELAENVAVPLGREAWRRVAARW